MNASNFAHAILAVWLQAACVLIAHFLEISPLTAAICGGLFAVGFYFGREVAQAERKAGTPPWYSGFLPKNWSRDSFFDFVIPLLGNILFVLVLVEVH